MKLSYRVNKEKEVNGTQEMENTFIDENRVYNSYSGEEKCSFSQTFKFTKNFT